MNIQLTNNQTVDRYGRVTIRNTDGSIDRVERISWEELQQLHAGEIDKPSCCTDAEWHADHETAGSVGLAVLDGVEDRPIGSIEDRNGDLRIRLTESVYAWLLKGEYSGELPNITCTADAAAEIQRLKSVHIKSIIDGLVEIE